MRVTSSHDVSEVWSSRCSGAWWQLFTDFIDKYFCGCSHYHGMPNTRDTCKKLAWDIFHMHVDGSKRNERISIGFAYTNCSGSTWPIGLLRTLINSIANRGSLAKLWAHELTTQAPGPLCTCSEHEAYSVVDLFCGQRAIYEAFRHTPSLASNWSNSQVLLQTI